MTSTSHHQKRKAKNAVQTEISELLGAAQDQNLTVTQKFSQS